MQPELALFVPNMWPVNVRQLRVKFLDGSPELRARIVDLEGGPNGWNSASAMQFVFTQQEPSHIRITFTRGASWSYVGTQCKYIAADQPTMQLGWLDTRTEEREVRRVWLHEAGHALGFWHEHETVLGIDSIPWDYKGINKWCKDKGITYQDWEKTWNCPADDSVIMHPIYDEDSIMHYYVPPEWVLDRIPRGGANTLSSVDRQMVEAWYEKSPKAWYHTFLPVTRK